MRGTVFWGAHPEPIHALNQPHLVYYVIALGLWMIGIPKSPPGIRAYWFNVHKSIGLTLAALILLRVVWRLAHRAPPLPDAIAERLMAVVAV